MYFNSKNQLEKLIKTSYCFARWYRYEWLFICGMEDALMDHYTLLQEKLMKLNVEKNKLEHRIDSFLYMALRGPDNLDYIPSDSVSAMAARVYVDEALHRLKMVKSELLIIRSSMEILDSDRRKLSNLKFHARAILMCVRKTAIQNDNPVIMPLVKI